MSEITTIGLDLAKHVFQVHGIDAQGTTVLAFFSRIPRCVVGLEACATAHYWARELGALGHEVRLMPAQYVKAYFKRNKHDAADAEAICRFSARRCVLCRSRRQSNRRRGDAAREGIPAQGYGRLVAHGTGAGACERAMTRDRTVGRSDATERSLPFHWDIDPARMMRPRWQSSGQSCISPSMTYPPASG